MAALKPAYLIHGDDHGRVSERRAGLRVLAEREGGVNGLEVLEGEAATPEAAAGALSAMTFALGHRVVIVDGVERWKAGDLDPLLAVLKDMPPDTTVAFFGRDEGRFKVPDALGDAVAAAGGQVAQERTAKPWELPKWAMDRAKEVGLSLDASGARALVARAGARQQRLLRELERLVLELGPGSHIGAEEVEELGESALERKAWDLADAMLAGDAPAAVRLWLALSAQGEGVGALGYWGARRFREALGVVARLDAGESESQARRDLRMPPKAAEQLVRDARRHDREGLRRAIARLADLELATRGGGTLEEQTATLRAVLAITA